MAGPWEIPNNNYENAKSKLGLQDTPALDAKIEELNKSNQIANEWMKKWDIAQGKDRQSASNLFKWFEIGSMSDMYDIKYSAFNSNQEITLSHNETGENNTVDKPMETEISSTPEQQAAIKDVIKNTPAQGNGNSLNKQEIQKTLDNVASLFPQKLWDFIKKLFAIFTGSTDKNTEGIKKDISKFIDNNENKAKLESYWPKITDAEKGWIQLQFAEWAKITGEKTTQKINDVKDETKPSKIDIKDWKIILADGAKISSIVEKDEKLYLAVDNKDKSHDVYVIEWAKPSEKPSKGGA